MLQKLRSLKRRYPVLVRTVKHAYDQLRGNLHLHDDEQRIVASAQRYWNDPSLPPTQAHRLGDGVFADEAHWIAVGQHNLAVFQSLLSTRLAARPLRRIVEWGCGGGSNLAAFGPTAEVFYGTEIAADTLDECARQADRLGLACFKGVLFHAAQPEAVCERITEPCDLFLCTYVFELLPSEAYGERVLRIAHQLLEAGGLAFVQIRYQTEAWQTKAKKWNYALHASYMTTYRTEEFWELAMRVGFTPRSVFLEPRQPLVYDERYAYFLLEK